MRERREKANVPQSDLGSGRIAFGKKPVITLAILLTIYLLVEFLIPLRTTIQIGGDEGFELGKATLCLKGYKLYADVWNDQPPFHTFLVTEILKHVSPSVLGPRLLTIGFAIVLLTSVFFLLFRISGLVTAALATFLIIFSPDFTAVTASCMLEVPALSSGLTALSIAAMDSKKGKHLWEMLAGVIWGLSLLSKLISVILGPLLILVIVLRYRGIRQSLIPSVLLGLSAIFAFVMTDCLIDKGAYIGHFHQSWISHFGGTRSFEYGSPQDYPFDWRILLKNWDLMVPALFGLGVGFGQARKTPLLALPAIWLFLELIVFAIHKPWWPYYYVHIAVPLCCCAAVGIVYFFRQFCSAKALLTAFSVFLVGASVWMGSRVWLQIREIRSSPQTYDSLVLNEIDRYKSVANWIYAEKEIYSFHSGIPMPPPLGVLMLKRLWSGDMTNDRIASEIEKFKPGLILLDNSSRVMPFQDQLQTEYRLIYEDSDFRLYGLKTMLKKSAS